ncbi:MAG TPA: hypothetical protein DEP18_06795 [Flavobacteriales bacterium]|nr:hypothetical protein [Flavobacteriales bacterium]HRE75786.1 AI-2E family transporter [Flavobacteriales bacterium]HRE98590.1 AI-2E family transporter [Flavobacteriales bacterium]HRJ36190.1 AI-2E family transporter [Flavobacteriales bacterium]HRJ37151.1 AI-2E family transporter [Flavobacteriales bacterium]
MNSKWINTAAVLIVIIIGGFLLIYFESLFKPLVIGGLLSLILLPVYRKLLQWRLPRFVAMTGTVLLTASLLTFLISLFSTEVKHIGQELPELLPGMERKLDDLGNIIENYSGITHDDQVGYIKNALRDISGNKEQLFSQLFKTAGGILSLVLSLFYMMMFLLYKDGIRRFFLMVAVRKQEQSNSIMNDIKVMMKNYFIGILTVMLIVGIVIAGGLSLLGIKHGVFFGLLAALLSIVPYVGIISSGIICIFYSWAGSESFWIPVIVIAIYYSVQLLEGNLLTPFITGGSAKINPLATLFGLLLGSALWGVTGMILAIPMLATTRIICDHVPEWKAIAYLIGEDLAEEKSIVSKKKKN